MPPRAPSRNRDLASIADTGRGSEFRRTSRHHQPSRFAKETPLSPRASQSLKFKDKGARIENPIRPPNTRLPEFLKNDSSRDELVKYMSKVPGYLQKGENIQDSVLNFGVLDWGRLEKWTHKESQSSTSHTGSSVDFSPVVKPMKEKVINPSDVAASNSTSKKHVNHRKDKVTAVGVELKSAKGKEMDRKQESHMKSAKGKQKCLYQDSEVSGRSNKEPYNADAQQKKGCEDFGRPAIDCSNEQDSIVLLLPKDFSRPSSSELPRKAAFHAKSGQHNWGSFSDLFSIDEIHVDESFSDIPPSCSADPDPIVETEKDLDLKLDTLIKAQGVVCPDKPQDSSIHQRFGFGLARMTRSLSLKEGSIHPPLSSTHVTAKSGPAKTEGPLNVNVKARANPFKRLLDPILKSKVVSHTRKQSNDSVMEPPPVPVVVPEVEICEALTVKALLHHTVKGGLPLFKFVVETNNEILASTVKSLSSLNKDEISLMYTFYSVQKVRKKSSGWKNQKVKPCRYGYNVVGQMKVSKESVLYSVDVSKSDAASSEIVTGREIAAIVVNIPNEGFNNLKYEKSPQTVVILPGGDHSQPHEGVASSLINRWRTGGLCDCGGWDEGCKLRILAELQDRKGQLCSRSGLMDIRCDLYDQGESKESSPLFRLVPFRDGLYSVEFDPKMSSLQAFSICVAVINNNQPTISSDACDATHQVESKHEFGAGKASFVPAVHHTHPQPPVSPVGRV